MSEYCDYIGSERHLLAHHMKDHSDELPHICKVCQHRFKTVNSWQNHMDTHTQNGDIVDEETNVFKSHPDARIFEYACPYCDYTGSKCYLLTRHMKCHSQERPHTCKVCDCRFKNKVTWQNHMNTHTQTKPHPCRECESAFTTSSELVRHIRYKHTHEKPHQCTECDYASVELSKMKRHMRCHTGECPSSYQCPHCPHASSDTHKLKVHLRMHTGEKPYACDICQARFTQTSSLKMHLRIHSKNRRTYQCMYCRVTCRRKTDLRIHVQKFHSSDKMLEKSSNSLQVHLSIQNRSKDVYQCAYCPSTHGCKTDLWTHIQKFHSSDSTLTCKQCGKVFQDKCSFKVGIISVAHL